MKYNIIYADPPWAHNNKKSGGSMQSGAASKYSVMGIGDICSLPIRAMCAEDCFLFMWWVASMPKEAMRVVHAWGFEIKTMTCFSWIKKTKNGKDHFGMGYYSRQQQEHCLIARRGRPKVVSHSVRQNIYDVVREHSEKPSEARDRIIELCGDLPRLEMFSRARVDGWDAFGDEIDSDVVLRPRSRADIRNLLKRT